MTVFIFILTFDYDIMIQSTDTNNVISMRIFLPYNINGLQTVEENLHKVNITHFLMGDQYEVDLYLPKFKIESKIDLKVPLSTLGMEEIFGNNANFTRITSQPPLKVSKIIQKAFIEVNEEGSEAAAVTGKFNLSYSKFPFHMSLCMRVTFNPYVCVRFVFYSLQYNIFHSKTTLCLVSIFIDQAIDHR